MPPHPVPTLRCEEPQRCVTRAYDVQPSRAPPLHLPDQPVAALLAPDVCDDPLGPAPLRRLRIERDYGPLELGLLA